MNLKYLKNPPNQDKLEEIRNYSGGYGRCFTRHAVNTCNASPAALRIPCSVCSPAHTSMYGRSQLLIPLLTLLRSPYPCTLDRGRPGLCRSCKASAIPGILEIAE